MLVLSRRPEEKIVLPTIPAVIKVISAQSNLVRLGIEAPSHVTILREELCEGAPPEGANAGRRHALRNSLNNLALGLTLLRLQLREAGPAVQQTLDGLERELGALRSSVGAGETPTPRADLTPPLLAGQG
jgi:carbon storage regulator CsrA